jgi:hypothetical protein
VQCGGLLEGNIRVVQRLLREIDPEGSNERRLHRLKRREYNNPGPNFCWHADGYDKLKPHRFPIHGCIDGFSRRVLWLACNISNPTMRTGLDFKFVQFDQVRGEAEDWIKMRGLEI